MAFTAGDHLSLENKGNEIFSWQDMADEPNTSDFFEQYVMLNRTESGSPTGEGENSFDELGEAHDMATFSPLVPSGSCPSLERPSGTSSANQGGSSSLGVSAYTNQSFAPPQQSQSQPNRQIRAQADMLHHQHHNTMEQSDHSIGTYELSGGGSISDSELLKLEGLTMGSPRVHLPPMSASVPPSPHSQSTSPKKGGRLEAIYARIRNKAATFQGKTRQQPQSTAVDMQPPTISTASMGSPSSKALGMGKSKLYNLQTNKPHLPISPPLTGSMADLSHQAGAVPVTGADGTETNVNGMQFVNSFLEDPFFDPSSLLGAMPQTNGGVGPSTPLHTSLLNTLTTSAGSIPSQPAIVWQLGPDGKTLWSPTSMDGLPRTTDSSSFLADPNSTAPDNTWWDDRDAMDTDNMGDVNAAIFQQQHHRNMNNTALNLAMQQLHQQSNQRNGNGAFEYPLPPGAADDFAASGLMIHMPQPRTPAAAVLDPSYYPGGNMPQSGEVNGGGNARHTWASERAEQKRTKPRAPSSGARYHHHHPSGAMTSPRKTRTASGSGPGGSGGRTTPSPSRAPGEGGPSRRLHRRSASMNTLNNHGGISTGPEGLGLTNPNAIRKRKSWTGRRLGATEAAAAAAAVSVPPVPTMPAGMLSPQQHVRANGTNNIARRVSSTSSLAWAATAAGNKVAAVGTGRKGTRHQQQQAQQARQMAANHGHMLRNQRSMPQLTLQVPPIPQLPPHLADHPLHPMYHQHQHQHQQQQLHPHPHPTGKVASASSASRRQTKRPSHDRKHSAGSNTSNGDNSRNGGTGGAGAGAGAGLGFVNFTPNDHNILMTGVAPSGSSKTKARREKEAAERQRRLSEAVVKAVAAAGGDLTKLEQEGIVLS